jgi:hypothetical protein
MQTKILHHLFLVVGSDVIKAPLWDVAAQGPTAFPNNSTFVNQQVSQLLTTSFPNMQPRQVEVPPLPSIYQNEIATQLSTLSQAMRQSYCQCRESLICASGVWCYPLCCLR